MAILGSYFWSGFPYDNLCELTNEELEASNVIEKYSSLGNDVLTSVLEVDSLNSSDIQLEAFYHFCSQDFLGRPDSNDIKRFPATSTKDDTLDEGGWMTDEQATMVCI